MSDFEALGLTPAILKAIAALHYGTPTPIQAEAIPLVLANHDLLGLAQTGTGKTAAFGLPLVQQLGSNRERLQPRVVRSLILAPTRELVGQIADNMKGFVAHSAVSVRSVVGGQSINVQRQTLERGADILVATPGRLLDLVNRRFVDLRQVTHLVLDEADQMLDMGFINDLRKIAEIVPKERQTLLFSATMPKQIEDLSKKFLNDPVKVQVSPPGKAADKITQGVHYVPQKGKTKFLTKLLLENPHEVSLVFARTKHGAERLMKTLVEAGLSAVSVHGNKNQNQRDRALRAFKKGDANILVATDVAARGIDIPGVSHVYNFEMPEVAENYVHRIGRTARAGAEGKAISLVGGHELHLLKGVEKLMSIKIEIISGDVPEAEEPPARKGRGGGRSQGAGQKRGGQKQGRGAGKGGPGRGRAKQSGQDGGKSHHGQSADTVSRSDDRSGNDGESRPSRRNKGSKSTVPQVPDGGWNKGADVRPERPKTASRANEAKRRAKSGGNATINPAGAPNKPSSANKGRPKWAAKGRGAVDGGNPSGGDRPMTRRKPKPSGN